MLTSPVLIQQLCAFRTGAFPRHFNVYSDAKLFADMISKISRGVVPPAVRQLVPEIRSSKAIVSPIREVAESIAIPQIIIGEIPSWHL